MTEFIEDAREKNQYLVRRWLQSRERGVGSLKRRGRGEEEKNKIADGLCLNFFFVLKKMRGVEN